MAGETLHFEDVNVGDTAPEASHTLTRTDFVKYAGASGDFNPIHHDEVKAKAAGQPSVFGHGMFSMGLLGRVITDWVGLATLRRYQVRFERQHVLFDECARAHPQVFELRRERKIHSCLPPFASGHSTERTRD
jgi:acyl dehydratase